MANPVRMEDLNVSGSLTVSGTVKVPSDGVSAQGRSTVLVQDANAIFPIPWSLLRVWDAYATNLPATAASDDLGLVGGTFGSAGPLVTAGDCKAAGTTTRYARFQVALPECYDAGETISIAVSCGMVTTIADGSCNVDIEAYKQTKIATIGSDLCATAQQSMNSLTFATKSFTITPTGLVAGDILDVRLKVVCVDAATATAVTPTIGGLDLVCDIKG